MIKEHQLHHIPSSLLFAFALLSEINSYKLPPWQPSQSCRTIACIIRLSRCYWIGLIGTCCKNVIDTGSLHRCIDRWAAGNSNAATMAPLDFSVKIFHQMSRCQSHTISRKNAWIYRPNHCPPHAVTVAHRRLIFRQGTGNLCINTNCFCFF